jgi:polyisoprenoid-binding protein YceI
MGDTIVKRTSIAPYLTAALVVVLVTQAFDSLPRLRARPSGNGEAKSAGGSFEVDTKTSRIYVRVDPDGRGHAHGVVAQLQSGSLTLGATEKAGELVFDLASFVADEPRARQYVGLEGKVSDSDRRSVTRTMLGTQVLNVRQYPKATYEIASVIPLDGQAAGRPGRYRFDGRLSLHGAEQPVRFEAKAEASGTEGGLRLRGQFSLTQSDYQMKPYSALFGALKVKDELVVHGDLRLNPKPTK